MIPIVEKICLYHRAKFFGEEQRGVWLNKKNDRYLNNPPAVATSLTPAAVLPFPFLDVHSPLPSGARVPTAW